MGSTWGAGVQGRAVQHAALKSILITHHKIITIIELLDSPNQRVIQAVLQVTPFACACLF